MSHPTLGPPDLLHRERPRHRNSLWTPARSPGPDRAPDLVEGAEAASALALSDLSHSIEAVPVT